MSENGEIYAAGKNFTLPPALTAWTNSTSVYWCPETVEQTETDWCPETDNITTQTASQSRLSGKASSPTLPLLYL